MSANTPKESVWSYPRPPRVEAVDTRLCVIHEGATLADAPEGQRVLETSHPPCYYLPAGAVAWERLVPSQTRTLCEFKGQARYWDLRCTDGRRIPDVCWMYENPTRSHQAIAGMVSFYAGKVDACYVGEQRVRPQAGDFYGGWITDRIVGPFKGGPGTQGW